MTTFNSRIIAVLALILLTVLSSAGKKKTYNAMNDFTDYPTYDAQWKQVQDHENEGKPKSAAAVVEEIYTLASNSNNAPQILKTLFYRSKYALTLEENAELSIVEDFKSEIAKANQPSKSLLESALAEMYWQYFNANRYRFINRSETQEFKPEDFRTWDLDALFKETTTYYNASLAEKKALQQIPLEDFAAILDEQEDAKMYRPTLYDFLAHRALDFYKNDVNGLTKPAYKFEITDEEAFDKASNFKRWEPTTRDRDSQKLKALEIYQDLIAFHENDRDAAALVNVDLQRLAFVYSNARMSNKDELYEKALIQLKNKYQETLWSVQAVHELAQLYVRQGNGYNPENGDASQWKLKEALSLIEPYIEKYPKAAATKNLRVLKASILQPSVSITHLTDVANNTTSPIKVHYKNLENVHFKLAKISKTEMEKIQDKYGDELNNHLLKLKGDRAWGVKVPNLGDYQNHSFETTLEGLKNGHYIVVAGTKDDFTYSDNALGFAFIQATDITYITRANNGFMDLYLMDRTSGKPLANASIEISTRRNRNNSEKLLRNYTTDKNGYAKINVNTRNYYNLNLKAKHNGDEAIFQNFYYRQYNRSNSRYNDRAFIFTDRSIYRPGQTVHFKAIVLETNGEKSNLQTGKSYNVVFRDANYQVVKELELTTNDYGSFSESFIAPQDRLNGNYTIDIQGAGSHSISVEEYKRPKFKPNFEAVKGSFKLGDKVTVTGKAEAYSGANITDAKVQYRVKRQAVFPYWYWYWWRPQPVSDPMEITFGETTTDEQGNFTITFEAIPDKSLNAEDLPVFNYEVIADVTDINGETRSTSTTVRVGYTAMEAFISMDNVLNKNDKEQITITTKNLNGEAEAAKGKLVIHKLQAPNRVLVPRKWTAGDQHIMDSTVFVKQFPHLAYGKEDNFKSWKKGAKVFDETWSTDSETGETKEEWKVGKRLASGYYIAELTSKDAFGKEIKTAKYFSVADENPKKVADNKLFEIKSNKDSYEPGEQVTVSIGSAVEDLHVLLEVEHKGKILEQHRLAVNNEIKTISFPVEEKYRGGLVVHYSLVKYNHQIGGVLPITVPWTNKELEIDVATFRDKLKPGQEEMWKFTVKGHKKDGVAAEMLAGMYDASLDQFKGHDWNMNVFNSYARTYLGTFNSNAFGSSNYRFDYNWHNNESGHYQNYDALNWFGFGLGHSNFMYVLEGRATGVTVESGSGQPGAPNSVRIRGNSSMKSPPSPMADADTAMEEAVMDVGNTQAASESQKEAQQNKDFGEVVIRKNLQETAFFFPHLETNAQGDISFSFTIPEALTQWKFMGLAHTKELATGITTQTTVTQKELMVVPNAPRFFRQGDEIYFTSKISNLTEKELTGNAELQLFDAFTMKRILSLLDGGLAGGEKDFLVNAKGNTNITWNLNIPEDVEAVTYRIVAKAGNFSDGEENGLPVLTNRMLVTETLPLPIRGNSSKTFVLDKLKNNSSSTLVNHKLTLEMTSNPAWYAVQALPYLMEYPYECAEQTFSRYYANSLATHVANSNPKIQEVFNTWKNYQPDALLSNLEKNEELKSVLLQESPWVREAQSETEQKRRIALLFDLNKMGNERRKAINKLQQMQLSNGGWPWFKGGRANRYITQHIVAGLGHLDALGVEDIHQDRKVWAMTQKAIQFLDEELQEDYRRLLRYTKKEDLSKSQQIGYSQFHYFYMRSFFMDVKVKNSTQTAFDFYMEQMKKYWVQDHLYTQGLIGLALHRYGDEVIPNKIITSLDEKSITSEELGMYWKGNKAGWYWYQAPIETQALMIEAFDEIANDQTKVDELKVWLLKHKQTNSWKTTKATSEAVYALLLRGGEWLAIDELVNITVGQQIIDPKQLEDVAVEAGTGYFKTSWDGDEVTKQQATVSVTKDSPGVAWGGLYWQYFEDLDKITTFEETPLTLNKKVFKQSNTDKGPVITPITEVDGLEVGDLLKVRIELRVDRDMEFIHMKDMRAAGLEPVNVISQYKWQDGLGYYETTKDASTNFFFDFLPKGVYVFEYPLRVSHSGDFSNGITTIQSMYAPEFTSHSEGVRIKVD